MDNEEANSILKEKYKSNIKYQDIVKDTVEEIKKQGISSKENLILVYAETVENDDGTTTLNIYDSDSNDFLWITPPNCIIGSIEKDNEQKIYLMKMYGGN